MTIIVENVSKTFGSFHALREVSLGIETGELVGLLGPSGSGKTTLLRIIAGLERPDPGSGLVRFDDREVEETKAAGGQVGFVFQHYALFRHMTVFENIAFGLRVRPRKLRPSRAEIERRVEELLRLIQLEGLVDRYPEQLSGGQRQRVALARALAVEPKVLLLDEPFGALDTKVRRELRSWLRRLHDELDVTSVFVTHDQEEALELADRVVVMNAGRIEQVGTPEDVYSRPQSEFVVDFLGDINRLEGQLDGGTVVVDGLPLELSLPTDSLPADATQVRIFLRPQDLEISLHPAPGMGFPATVDRVRSAGPAVRLELVADSGLMLRALLSKPTHGSHELRRGRRVFVSLRDYHVFPVAEAVALTPGGGARPSPLP